MLDEEFNKQYPVSVYHGTRVQDGKVVGRFSHPRVAEGIFADTEIGIFQMIKMAQAQLHICPQDTNSVAELEVNKRALAEVQDRKRRLGMPLEAPTLDRPQVLTVITGGGGVPSLNCDLQ